ncbi:MAG: PEP-utilizing enzyme [Candidatus Gottesmanbacteria bacterium]|nr:PEP-utilizing enzyme [Candidatus Gottesmanbacteria bacterium]
MERKNRYQKLFSRDFCLPSVEAWVRGESINPKKWTQNKQPFLPYLVTERYDDTVHFYYDPEGVAWVQNELITLARRNKDFIPTIEKEVGNKIRFLRPIYEKEQAIDLPTLKRFLKDLEAAYPWLEAMWWFFQMDDESKITGLDLINLSEVRKQTNTLCNSSDTVIRKSLINIYPQLGDVSSVLTTSEIISDHIPPKDMLEERYKQYFFTQGQLFLTTNKSTLETLLKITFKQETVEKVRQLTGMPAYRGIVRGFVRRVMGHKQINNVKDGEIVVSPMTIPDFTPALIKAAAIVTDEGGILSHAAIIAREFQTPTVVGTSIATKRLKDNDIVEVNATEGKVTLICHASIIANTLKKPCIIGTHFATDTFVDGDYVEVDADNGVITLLNRKGKTETFKKTIPWKVMFE